MRYAFVEDVPATWDTYRGIAETLSTDCPKGLVLHAAGPTDEGFRMIGIWDSRGSWVQFRDERLSNVLEALTLRTRTQPTYRELRIAHLMQTPGFLGPDGLRRDQGDSDSAPDAEIPEARSSVRVCWWPPDDGRRMNGQSHESADA
jgi:hypothetical protein